MRHEEPVRIEFFQMKTEVADLCNEFVNRFNDLHPEYRIEQVVVPDARQVFKSRMASGNMPDISSNWPESGFRSAVENGFILELTGCGFLSAVDPDVLEQVRVGDGDFILPLTWNATGILYHADLLRRYGIQLPNTFEDLLEACRILENEGVTPFVLPVREPLHVVQSLQPFLIQMDNYETFMHRTLLGIPATKAERQALTESAYKIRALYDFAPSGSVRMSYGECMERFASGEAAMMMGGTWAVGTLLRMNPKAELAMMPLPDESGVLPRVGVFYGDFALCLSAETKHAGIGKDFLAFFTESRQASRLSEVDGSPSCLIGVDQRLVQMEGLLSGIRPETSALYPDSLWSRTVSDQVGLAMQELLIGKSTENWLTDMERIFVPSDASIIEHP